MQDYRKISKTAITNTENLIAYEYERLHEAYAKKKEKRLMNEAIDKGINKEKVATAKRLYDANVSIDIIKTATGFNEKQIKNICL